jgi:hypothetical protein
LTVFLIAAASCTGNSGHGEARSEPRTAPSGVEILVDIGPLDPEQLQALRALAETTAGPAGERHTEGHAEGHGSHGGDTSTMKPSPQLEAELKIARRAAEALMTEERLADAGYHIGSYWSRGVGTHYIDWRLVGKPFDPARPAMLLIDTTPGHPRRLAGFSYWVGNDGPPAGFSDDADEWHNHRGLCFIDAILVREGVSDPASCEGVWIGGEELWMLHAWVVPGYENPDGIFAPRNPKLCPARTGIDAAWC